MHNATKCTSFNIVLDVRESFNESHSAVYPSTGNE